MTRNRRFALLALPLLVLSFAQGEHRSLAAAAAPDTAATGRVRALLDTSCVTCHNARLRTAGLQLETVDASAVGADPRLWEKIAHALRAQVMPPPGRRSPDAASRVAVATDLEAALDRESEVHPNPGRATVHRLNRSEYTNAIRDMFGLQIDGRALLPGDNTDAHGFDNNADVLSTSPLLMERYLSAAHTISASLLGRPDTADFTEVRVHKWLNQDDRMSEDLPFGSRGGVAVPYLFPADGEYVVKLMLHRTTNDHIKGLGAEHLLDVRLDGALVKRFTVGGDQWVKLAPPENYSSNIRMGPEWEDYSHNMDRSLEVRFPVKAGSRVVGVSFVAGEWSPEGIIQPQVGVSLNRNELPDGNPAVASVAISGPFTPSSPGDSAVRRGVLVCAPQNVTEETPCARTILTRLARLAYRRPPTDADLEPLLAFYRAGRANSGFDDGIQSAIERLLVSPSFLFRAERDANADGPHAVSDLELASRLSFFLWSSIPDEELLDVATKGTLREPVTLERQVRRMLADHRSRALVDNFVAQWLVVRNLRDVVPDSDLFPQFDENLRHSFEEETELFMTSQIRENRGLADMLTADYTFADERLAKHYGIPGVYGPQFRRVTVTDPRRQGLLGHGSVLTVTSYPNRTSPVLRGKWLLETFLGTPPPPPPPNIPALRENTAGTPPVSVRERLAAHRQNPACASCHARMDPLGFALEQFDAIGGWRDTELPSSVVGDAEPPGGVRPQPRIDVHVTMPDGTSFSGPEGLRAFLLSRPDQLARTVIERLLTYAIGRDLDYYDEPAVRRIAREAAPDERWLSIVLGVVTSTPFQMRSQ